MNKLRIFCYSSESLNYFYALEENGLIEILYHDRYLDGEISTNEVFTVNVKNEIITQSLVIYATVANDFNILPLNNLHKFEMTCPICGETINQKDYVGLSDDENLSHGYIATCKSIQCQVASIGYVNIEYVSGNKPKDYKSEMLSLLTKECKRVYAIRMVNSISIKNIDAFCEDLIGESVSNLVEITNYDYTEYMDFYESLFIEMKKVVSVGASNNHHT